VEERSKWTLVAWAVAAALAALALVRIVAPGDREAPAVALDGGGERVERSGSGAGRGGAAQGGRLYVHVAGSVRRPGLYRVPGGSRVAAAVDAAGGPSRRAELTSVNLAAPLEDGQQVVVPRAGAAPSAGPGSTSADPAAASSPGAAAGAKVSLGTATLAQLDSLDGIGPTLAKRIVAYRESHGGFRSVGQLREVEGIGEKRFAALSRALGP
jgi:competence protein ComEA